MGVEEARAWTDFLKEAGGWGVAVVEFVVLGGVIAYLWREYKAKDATTFRLLDKTNEIFQRLPPPPGGAQPPPVQLPPPPATSKPPQGGAP